MGRLPLLLLNPISAAMELIIKALAQAYPQADLRKIDGNTRFEEIKGWDSMTSVNFQIELENLIGGEPLDFVITGDQTVQALARVMQTRGLLPKS